MTLGKPAEVVVRITDKKMNVLDLLSQIWKTTAASRNGLPRQPDVGGRWPALGDQYNNDGPWVLNPFSPTILFVSTYFIHQ